MKRDKLDETLGRLLKEQVSEAPQNEWFVRKVMNRLPEKRQSVFSKAEIFSFAIVSVILIAFWGIQVVRLTTSDVITVTDLVGVFALFLCSVSFLCYIAYPVLKRG